MKKSIFRWALTVLVIGILSSQVAAQINIVDMTAKQLAEGYAQGNFTVADVTQAYLERINNFEINYNAFTYLNEDALSIAESLDAELSTSGARGPLHGVPVVIKDQIDVVGMPNTMGLAELSSQAGGVDLIPNSDAPVVERLKHAGAIIIGRTNMPGYGLDATRTSDTFISSWDGHTRNAYDRSLAPGASSAGTGTAVSASFGTLGLGTESGGSIQNPSGAQGLVGIKPSFGVVPNTRSFGVGSARAVVGPMALSVYDAAITMDVIAGPSVDDPKTVAAREHLPEEGYTSMLSTNALEGARVGLYGTGWSGRAPSTETQQIYESALKVLEQEGAILVEDPFAGTEFAELAQTFFGVGDVRGMESIVFDTEQYLEKLFDTDDGLGTFEAVTGVNLFREGGKLRFLVDTFPVAEQSLSDPDAMPDLSEFTTLQNGYRDIFDAVMEENELDALVFPQMLHQTPSLGGDEVISASSVDAINIMGIPGVTVPGGYYENGSPFSLIFMGDLYSEPELLGYAYDYEQATQHRVAPDLIHVADADRNGQVNFADFLVLSDNFGKRRSGTHRGDFNADSRVDFVDFLILSSSFGYGTEAAVSIPEPSSSSAAIVLGFFLVFYCRSFVAFERADS